MSSCVLVPQCAKKTCSKRGCGAQAGARARPVTGSANGCGCAKGRVTRAVSAPGVTHLDPGRRMVARLFPAAHVAIDPRLLEPRGERGIEQEMIDAQPGIALIGVTKVVPERIDLRVRVLRANRIRPSLPQQLRVGFAHLDAEERIVHPALRLVDIALGGYHVVITREHDGSTVRD